VLPTRPGLLVGGRYELIRRLGAGSMGEVWVARHRTLDERVAVKLLARSPEHVEFEDAATAAARFRFEAQVAARLSRRTRHIVQVTDHGEEGVVAYLVMELLEGETLDTLVTRRGCLSPSDTAELLRQVARGLAHAHAEGVVHRDLKPANVFVTCDEDGTRLVKLLDFGIARMMRAHRPLSPHATGANVVLGTAGYMSPEQIEGETPPDRSVDLWALATVAYEALTGELPLPGFSSDELIESLRERRFVPVHERDAALPAGLAAFFERAFAEDVAARHQSALELAGAFASAVASGPDSAVSPYAPTERAVLGPSSGAAVGDALARRPWGRRWAIGAAVLTTLVAAAAALGAAWIPAFAHGRVRTLTAKAGESTRAVDTSPSVEALAPLDALAPTDRPADRVARGQYTPEPTTPTAAPAAGSASAVGARTSRCDPPFEVVGGFKRWKRECL